MNEEARKREDDYYAGTMKDDYISRKAVLDMLNKECGSCADTGYIFSLPGIEERKTEWIPVKSRPMDDEERKEWSEKLGYDLADDEAVIYSNLPDDGQECIVCTKWGNVFIDTFQNDPDYGCYFEDHGDMDGITAWMPLPKPWKGEKE